jgi:hypothetical protein
MKETKRQAETRASTQALRPRGEGSSNRPALSEHVYNKQVVCVTDAKGFKTHRNLKPSEIRVDATDGFIPLWDEGVTLRYRFNKNSIERYFEDPESAKAEILQLFGEALEAWGDASPVKFVQDENVADFQIVMIQNADCDANGCVLASAFFPDSGRHRFNIYPTLFDQTREEQVETFIHEIGHIFGLRHFFANISETQWSSRLFGEDNRFSIMNYGHESVLTEADKADLRTLYRLAWNRQLTEIDGAPIRLFRPYSSLAGSPSPNSMIGYGVESAVSVSGNLPVQISIGGRRVIIE